MEKASSIPNRLERLPMTSVQWSIYWLCAVGLLFGSADIFTIFSIGTPVQTTFNLSSVELGLIISSAAPAAVAGAFVAGVLGDYLGRKAIFQYTLLLYAIGSVITGFAPNFYVFLLGRSILGFGIGGELPTIMALISEYVPRKIRGTLLALLNGMYAFGFVLATNLALAIVPNYTWRPLFFILAVPAIIVLILRRYGLPESARWLEAKGRKEEAEKIVSNLESKIEKKKGIKLAEVDISQAVPVQSVRAPLKEVFSGSTLKITVLLIWMWFITTFAGLGLPSFFIPILTSHFNY
ncbi:MAG: MFS transporter, partial [Conexivisphaerales archaeon]